jgi:anti-sigma regulatory factor (Ser/Thr protein kinase)
VYFQSLGWIDFTVVFITQLGNLISWRRGLQKMDLCVQFNATFSELDRLSSVLESFARQHHLSDKILFDLNLVLEEIFTNIIKHGYSGECREFIHLDLCRESEWVTISVRDGGCPFDPLGAPEADTVSPPEEREIGGLGIMLIRSLMDEVSYRRENGKNILTLRKRV